MLSQAADVAANVSASTPLVGLLVPVLVSAVAKNSLDPKFKALLAGLFSVGAALINSDGVVDQAALETALSNTFMALAAYKGIWDHVRLNDWLAPSRGIGPKPAVAEPGDPDFVPDNFETS
jgi:hypothetical protein